MAYLTLNSEQVIYYEQINPEFKGPVLVFLHEGLGSTAMWGDFPKLLCDSCDCPGLVYDRWGYGQSSTLTRPRTSLYLHNYALDELPQVLSAVIPNRSYILIGHSDGGSISLLFGATQPPQLMGIITEAAHVFVEDITLEGIVDATTAFNDGKLNGLEKFHQDKTETIFRAWSNTWLSPEFKAWNIEKEIVPVNVPVLVIQGIDDQYGTAGQVESICHHTSGPSKPCMINECGHTPHAEQKSEVLSKMNTFIKKLS